MLSTRDADDDLPAGVPPADVTERIGDLGEGVRRG
jgi:hypothetical protein